MKKIMLIGLIILSVFLIYLCNLDRKVYYLSLNGSEISEGTQDYSKYVKNYLKEKDVLEMYVNQYSKENMKITNLISNIEENMVATKSNKEITLKNALIKADLVTLSFSSKDIINRIDNKKVYDYIDDLSSDLDKLLKLMRQYCKEDIILVGFYNPNIDSNSAKVFKYLNNKYSEVSKEYNVDYINLNPIFEGHPDFLNKNNLPSQMGQNMISSEIINQIDKKMLKS